MNFEDQCCLLFNTFIGFDLATYSKKVVCFQIPDLSENPNQLNLINLRNPLEFHLKLIHQFKTRT